MRDVPVDIWIFTLTPTVFAVVSIALTLTTVIYQCQLSSNSSLLMQINSVITLVLLTICMILCVVHSFNYFESENFEQSIRFGAVIVFLLGKLGLYILFLHTMHDRFSGTQYDYSMIVKIIYLVLLVIISVILIFFYTYFYITDWQGDEYYLTSILFYAFDFILCLIPLIIFSKTLCNITYEQTFQLTGNTNNHGNNVLMSASRSYNGAHHNENNLSYKSNYSKRSFSNINKKSSKNVKNKNSKNGKNIKKSKNNKDEQNSENNENDNNNEKLTESLFQHLNNSYVENSVSNNNHIHRVSITSYQTSIPNSGIFSAAGLAAAGASGNGSYGVSYNYDIGNERFVFNTGNAMVRDITKYSYLLSLVTLIGFIVKVTSILVTLEMRNQTPIFGHQWVCLVICHLSLYLPCLFEIFFFYVFCNDYKSHSQILCFDFFLCLFVFFRMDGYGHYNMCHVFSM